MDQKLPLVLELILGEPNHQTGLPWPTCQGRGRRLVPPQLDVLCFVDSHRRPALSIHLNVLPRNSRPHRTQLAYFSIPSCLLPTSSMFQDQVIVTCMCCVLLHVLHHSSHVSFKIHLKYFLRNAFISQILHEAEIFWWSSVSPQQKGTWTSYLTFVCSCILTSTVISFLWLHKILQSALRGTSTSKGYFSLLNEITKLTYK